MTLRQLIICGIGGGFTYLIYLTLENQPFAIWAPPVIVLGILTLSIAFLKIRGIPFVQFLLLLLERYLNPTKRTWTKSAGDVSSTSATTQKPTTVKGELKKKKNYSAEEIAQITQKLDHSKKAQTSLTS